MLLGDPYKFSVFINIIKEWNVGETSFCNGILLFCIDGELFPQKVITTTLNSEIPLLKRTLTNLSINKILFNTEKEKAFYEMYKNTFLEEDNNTQYDISPSSFSDADYFVFAVGNGESIRIMAAKMNYIKEDSIHDFNNINIIQTFITNEELNDIIIKLTMVLN